MSEQKPIIKRRDFHLIEPDRDIILHCDDYMGDYSAYGRIIKYKDGKGSRFCKKVQLQVSTSQTWIAGRI